MSAYMVSKKHVCVVANARDDGGKVSDKVKTAKLLWAENKKSIEYRYSDNCDDMMPKNMRITKADFKNLPGQSPVELIKACHCLDYQSCEHPEWEDSEARQILLRIVDTESQRVEGYEQAAWGIS